MSTIILAKGRFPIHPVPLSKLGSAQNRVCCDGAAATLLEHGYEPTAIVGDFDSVSAELKQQFDDRLFYNPDQETNDLTKAVQWCKERGLNRLTILAGTGKRDDHTIGNVALLPGYARMGLEVEMITDYGVFRPLLQSTQLESYKGQQVSVFSFNPTTVINSKNLLYQLNNRSFKEPWEGTLNESLDSWFELEFKGDPIIVFQTHK